MGKADMTTSSPPRARGLSDRGMVWLFITPTILLLLGMTIFPLIWSLYLSFTNYSAVRSTAVRWVGFANYDRLLHNEDVWQHFVVTARFVVLAVGAEMLLGFGLALLLNRRFPGRGLIMTLMLTPMMLPPIVVGLFWNFIYRPDVGVINYYVTRVLRQPPIEWLTSIKLALYSIVIVDIWMWTPFVMLIALAGLSAIPRYLYEAAEVDRASAWFKFRHITLPLVWPLLLIALLFRTMDAFKMFDQVFILTGGGPGSSTETVSLFLYQVAFRRFNTGEASALGYIILIIIIALSNLYIRYLNKARAG